MPYSVKRVVFNGTGVFIDFVSGVTSDLHQRGKTFLSQVGFVVVVAVVVVVVFVLFVFVVSSFSLFLCFAGTRIKIFHSLKETLGNSWKRS